MFIVTGNNIQEQKVRILDTSDKKEDWVAYKKMLRGINQGLFIAGLDAYNNIVCQSLDLYKEVIHKLRLLEAKFVLLKLDTDKQYELILNILAPYGLAQISEDIQYSFDAHMLILREHGKYFDLELNSVRNVSVGVELESGLRIQDNLNRVVYNELNQMIFDMSDTTLHYLQFNEISRSYIAIIGTCCYEVQISNSSRYTSLAWFKQRYNKNMAHRVFFELYLEDVWLRLRQGPWFITHMELIAESDRYNEEVKQKMLQVADRHVKRL